MIILARLGDLRVLWALARADLPEVRLVMPQQQQQQQQLSSLLLSCWCL
jgi:hypothetical protein